MFEDITEKEKVEFRSALCQIVTPREHSILIFRYGKGYTLARTGEELNLSYSWVWKIQEKAMTKLEVLLSNRWLLEGLMRKVLGFSPIGVA